MGKMGELYQTADWKTEKHVPVIEILSGSVKADELFSVKISLGKEVAHPNTTEHHIRWIKLYFKGDGDKFPYEVGNYEFSAHGESVAGPNQGPVYTNHSITTEMKVNKAGMLYATAYCNIHGLWENTLEVKI
ncbi:MAG: class II SORL domain-containing protein [Syntrophotaleaceae bacterium]